MEHSSLGAASIGTKSSAHEDGANRNDEHKDPGASVADAEPSVLGESTPMSRAWQNGTPRVNAHSPGAADARRGNEHARNHPSKPVSQEPTWRQVPSDQSSWARVPVDAGMAEPIPVARSVSAAKPTTGPNPRKTKKKRNKRRKRKNNFYVL